MPLKMWARHAQLLRVTMLVISSWMILYGCDFYLLPTSKTSDHLAAITNFEVSRRNGGCSYQTEQGLTFGSGGYYPQFFNDGLQLQYSPIFKSVKGISQGNKNFDFILISDFNGIGKWFHLLTTLVLLIGQAMIAGPKGRDNELVMKVTLSAMLFMSLSGMCWFYWS